MPGVAADPTSVAPAEPEFFRKENYALLYKAVPDGVDSIDVHFLDIGGALIHVRRGIRRSPPQSFRDRTFQAQEDPRWCHVARIQTCSKNRMSRDVIFPGHPRYPESCNLTVDLVSAIGEKKDIPVVLNSINMQDDYEGDFTSRRSLIYTFDFTAKTYLFGPIADSSDGLIRKVQVDTYTNTDQTIAKREQRYTAVPDPIDADPADDFGFSETFEFFQDSKKYSPTKQEDI